jgi:hypothetical protein
MTSKSVKRHYSKKSKKQSKSKSQKRHYKKRSKSKKKSKSKHRVSKKKCLKLIEKYLDSKK